MSRAMDDVDRLFEYLVRRLTQTAPDRLQRPFQVSELYQRLVPYRLHRTELGFDSIEDYEMAVLRLLAGERGYVAMQPEDAQRVLAAEVETPNPTPGAFREFAAATMTLDPAAVRRIVHAEETYAPPAPPPPPAFAHPAVSEPGPAASPPPPPVPADPVVDPILPSAAARAQNLVFEPVHHADVAVCPGCAEALPSTRAVHFCPYCGLRIDTTPCRRCGDPVEPEWRYCPTCGMAVDE